MTDQNTFMELIKSVAEIIKTSEEPMSEEEILGYFSDMDLDDQQKKIIMEYLLNPPEETAEEENGQEEMAESSEENSGQSAILKMYLDELSCLPGYSREEEHEMYKALLQGEESVQQPISDSWLKRVITIAEKYIEPKINVEDLIQEGNMALFVTLKNLCGSREPVDVESVLEESIEKGIMTYASEINGERELENTVLGKVSLVHEAQKLLTEEKGVVPDVEELAEYTKMSIDELEDILGMIKEKKWSKKA